MVCPAMYVPKNNREIRICVDYVQLNKSTKDSYPVPRADGPQQKLAHKRAVSKLDLCSAYWQFPMCETFIEKAAFCPGLGYVWSLGFHSDVMWVDGGHTDLPTRTRQGPEGAGTVSTTTCLTQLASLIPWSPTSLTSDGSWAGSSMQASPTEALSASLVRAQLTTWASSTSVTGWCQQKKRHVL